MRDGLARLSRRAAAVEMSHQRAVLEAAFRTVLSVSRLTPSPTVQRSRTLDSLFVLPPALHPNSCYINKAPVIDRVFMEQDAAC